jgi:tRNA (Thr-GGU) A37 N-methylase
MTGFFALAPIGVVRGGRTEIFEDHWGPVEARLILDPAVLDPDATAGLSEFSHIEVVFHFDRESTPALPARRTGPSRQTGRAVSGWHTW